MADAPEVEPELAVAEAALPAVVPVEAPAVVAPPVEAAPALDAAVGPAEIEVVFKQSDDDPALTVMGADCATAPVLSRRVKPMDVPEAMLHTQVREVELVSGKFSRAVPLGVLPGRMLR